MTLYEFASWFQLDLSQSRNKNNISEEGLEENDDDIPEEEELPQQSAPPLIQGHPLEELF